MGQAVALSTCLGVACVCQRAPDTWGCMLLLNARLPDDNSQHKAQPQQSTAGTASLTFCHSRDESQHRTSLADTTNALLGLEGDIWPRQGLNPLDPTMGAGSSRSPPVSAPLLLQ